MQSRWSVRLSLSIKKTLTAVCVAGDEAPEKSTADKTGAELGLRSSAEVTCQCLCDVISKRKIKKDTCF